MARKTKTVIMVIEKTLAAIRIIITVKEKIIAAIKAIATRETGATMGITTIVETVPAVTEVLKIFKKKSIIVAKKIYNYSC